MLRRIGADGSVTLDLKGYSSEDGDLTWEGMVGEIEEIDTIQKQGIVVVTRFLKSVHIFFMTPRAGAGWSLVG